MTPKLIIGLGNPGAEYENTYHNVGALAVEELAGASSEGRGLNWKTHKKIFSYLSNLQSPISNLIFIRSLVFMNESGLAAKEALKKFNAVPEDLIVIHDDSDLVLGEFKISRGQSSAGHKGVQSVIDHLGTSEFERIRIGIREQRREKAGEFVLNQITPRDKAMLEKVFEEITLRL
jgi:PTH1 family peptidyl-tRNA hydrolase